jgi:RHS repeat-associated protein
LGTRIPQSQIAPRQLVNLRSSLNLRESLLELTACQKALSMPKKSCNPATIWYAKSVSLIRREYDKGNIMTMTYRDDYADYVDEPIVRHTGTATTLPTTGDNAFYYHRNQKYSIIGLTNAAGTLVERYSYSAYGTLGIYDPSGTVRTNSTYANRYTYTGREYDPDLALYHFRARWYDPATGGFISRDPLGYVDGMSLYRGYFGVSNADPEGFRKVCCKHGYLTGGATTWLRETECGCHESAELCCSRNQGLIYYWTTLDAKEGSCEGTVGNGTAMAGAGAGVVVLSVNPYEVSPHSCRPVPPSVLVTTAAYLVLPCLGFAGVAVTPDIIADLINRKDVRNAKNICAALAGCTFGTCIGACSLAGVFTAGTGGAGGGVAIAAVGGCTLLGQVVCNVCVHAHGAERPFWCFL